MKPAAVLQSIKGMKNAAVAVFSRAVPIRAWSFLSGSSMVVPLYHLVSDAPVSHVRHLYRPRTIREFEDDLEFILRHVEPVGLGGVLDSVINPRRAQRPGLHLTFDDGFRECHEVIAPLLRRKGIPATFFLATDFIDGGGMAHHNKISVLIDRINAGVSENELAAIDGILGPMGQRQGLEAGVCAIPFSGHALLDQIAAVLGYSFDDYVKTEHPHLTSQQILDLVEQGFTIGAHSRNHPLYRDLSQTDQLTQTRDSMNFVVSRFGAKIRAFAFPHNDEGVSAEFFDRAFDGGALDLSFGTNGMIRHPFPRNIERVVMEGIAPDARTTIASAYVRAIRRRTG